MHGSDKFELTEVLNEGKTKRYGQISSPFYKSRLVLTESFGIFALVKCDSTTWLTKSRTTGALEF